MIIAYTRLAGAKDLLVREIDNKTHRFEYRVALAVQEYREGSPDKIESVYRKWLKKFEKEAL